MKIITSNTKLQSFVEQHKLSAVFDHQICALLQMHAFEGGEVIIKEAAEVKYFYLMLEGQARVSPSSIDGKLGLLEFIEVMDVIGALEYFSGDTFYHSVFAVSPCTVLAIPTSMMQTYFDENIHFYKFICKNLAHIMKRTSVRYSSSLLYPLKNRLAKYLFDKYQQQDTSEIPLKTTQTAEYFGVTSRHLRRILADMEHEGVLKRNKAVVCLKDIQQLKKYAAYM